MKAQQQEEGFVKGVTLSSADVRQVIRLLELLTSQSDYQALRDSNDMATSRGGLLAVAKFAFLVRQGRSEQFSPAMFGEPAWDVLLALYLKESGGAAPTVSSLAKTAGVPISTAFRWIDYLLNKRLVVREKSSEDGRALTVALSDGGRERLERYFSQVLVRMAATRQELTIDKAKDDDAPRLSSL